MGVRQAGRTPLPSDHTGPPPANSQANLPSPHIGAEGVRGFNARLLPCSRARNQRPPAASVSAIYISAFATRARCCGFWAFCLRCSRWLCATSIGHGALTRKYRVSGWSRPGQPFMQISSALFLASLSPSRFQDLALECALRDSLQHSAGDCVRCCCMACFTVFRPTGPKIWVFPVLGAISLVVAMFWGAGAEAGCRGWLGVSFCGVMGCLTLWVCFRRGSRLGADLMPRARNLLMTALLLGFVFRRFSPGVVLSVAGLLRPGRSPTLQILPAISPNPVLA